MHLHFLTKMDLAGQLSSALAMLAVAAVWHSVWALVVGAITASLVKIVIGYVALPGHTVKFGIDKSAAAELMGHAKWIFLSSILGFMALNGDRVLLGGLISSRDFGLYSIALLLATVLQGVANSLCNSIAFPALSEVFRERPHDLPKTFEKFQWGYDVLVVFPAAVLMTAGSSVVDVMYDARYHDAGWMLAVLSFGLIGARYQPVEVGYLAVGKPKYGTIANFLRLATLAGGLFVGSHFFGLKGAIAGVALAQYAGWPIAIWFKARTHSLTWRAEIAVVPCLVLGLLTGELVGHRAAAAVAAPLHALTRRGDPRQNSL
jgi:O-antigen/teichoic acid export membrane protein